VIWQDSPFVPALLFTALTCAALGVFVWRQRPTLGVGPVVGSLMATGCWNAWYAMELASANYPAQLFWANMQYIPITATPALMFTFALIYTGRGSLLSRPVVLALFVEPVVTVFLAFNSDAMPLLRTDWEPVLVEGAILVSWGHGPFFWVHIFYSYLLMATATSILVPVILRSPHLYRTQAAAVVIGVLMPWLMNAMYVLDLSPYPRLNLMPFSFFFYAVAVGWALVRLRFLDVVPIARDGVVEGLQEAVLVFGMNGQIAAANPPAAGLLGRSARELVGLELSDLPASVSAALDPSKPVPAEHEIVVGDAGSSRVFELRVAGVNDHRGRPRGRVAVFHDLTDRKRAEEEQVGSQRLLAAGELAAGIAHNLNNILVGILAPAQRLQDGQTTELSRDAGIIVSAAERARDLVERLNCGTDWERPVRLESVDVAAVTAEAIEAARPRWEEVQTAGGQIVVSSQLGILLPARCDRTELHDAILNLILNAVDAMPEGGQVTIAAEVDQKNVILTVSDTGTGMDSETLRRVFEPFFTTKVNIGTGLGLSTVYRSVQHWDGDISATSQPGEGTTFRLALPLWEGAPVASAPQPSGEARATQILIAEDEAIVAMVLADYVRSQGHNVDIVGVGAEALERLSRGDVDVAILDLGIPDTKVTRLLYRHASRTQT
jgi:PAS domain S-box-containing protein